MVLAFLIKNSVLKIVPPILLFNLNIPMLVIYLLNFQKNVNAELADQTSTELECWAGHCYLE